MSSERCVKSGSLKIFHIITRLNVGGAALYNILLASHLQKKGHKVWMINGPAGSSEGEMLDYFPEGECDFRRFLIPELKREIHPWKDLKALFRLICLLRREAPDIVHTHTSKAGLLGRLAAIVAGVPYRIHSFHGTVFNEFFSRWISRLFIFLERFLGRHTSLFLADTTLIRQEIIKLGIARPQQIKVMPLGLDLDPYHNLTPFRGTLRNLLKLPIGAKIVGTVARLVPIKGIEYLLEAAAQLLPTMPDLCFVVVGDGELREALTTKAKTLGIANRVFFLGFWKDLRQIYADLDVIAVPSLSEGCPVAVLEGMAAQKPIVACAVGGIPDVITDGVNGLLVPSKNSAHLAGAIGRCLLDGGLAAHLAKRAKADVFDRYTIERSAALTESVYRSVLAGATAPLAGHPNQKRGTEETPL